VPSADGGGLAVTLAPPLPSSGLVAPALGGPPGAPSPLAPVEAALAALLASTGRRRAAAAFLEALALAGAVTAALRSVLDDADAVATAVVEWDDPPRRFAVRWRRTAARLAACLHPADGTACLTLQQQGGGGGGGAAPKEEGGLAALRALPGAEAAPGEAGTWVGGGVGGLAAALRAVGASCGGGGGGRV
jgi:hypothetical protein